MSPPGLPANNVPGKRALLAAQSEHLNTIVDMTKYNWNSQQQRYRGTFSSTWPKFFIDIFKYSRKFIKLPTEPSLGVQNIYAWARGSKQPDSERKVKG